MVDTGKLRRFKIAFSFPGEYRVLVETVASQLAKKYGKANILYDKYHRAEFARPNLDCVDNRHMI